MQKIAKFLSTDLVKMKKFIGVHILMGNQNFPPSKLYRESHQWRALDYCFRKIDREPSGRKKETLIRRKPF